MNLVDKVENKEFFSVEILERLNTLRAMSFKSQDRLAFEKFGQNSIFSINGIHALNTHDICEVLSYCGVLHHDEGGHDSYIRDWKYFYSDGEEVDKNNRRPCASCKKSFCLKASDGSFVDPCLGVLDGVTNACCGHGSREGYLSFEKPNEITKEGVGYYGATYVFRGSTDEILKVLEKYKKQDESPRQNQQ